MDAREGEEGEFGEAGEGDDRVEGILVGGKCVDADGEGKENLGAC